MFKFDSNSNLYIKLRYIIAFFNKLPYFFFGLLPIRKNKIAVITAYGTRGYACNPKGIVEELLNRENKSGVKYEIVWFTNNIDDYFPDRIKPVKNTNLRRAYHLSTSKIWIDSHRKHLEARKRKSQMYIMTWHGPIGFKKTGRTRPKEQFSKIAEIINKNDSSMADYCISNSKWCTDLYRNGFDYFGKVLEVGSPRMDAVVNKKIQIGIYEKYNIPKDAKILMYTPTLRNVSDNRKLTFAKSDGELDFNAIRTLLESKTNEKWYILVRQHPFIMDKFSVLDNDKHIKNCIDVTDYTDVYELLSITDILISDYSSLVFDACYVKIPVFLFVNDIEDYKKDRGLLWDLNDLPFPYANSNSKLLNNIDKFDFEKYSRELDNFFENVKLIEDGHASERVCDVIDDFINKGV